MDFNARDYRDEIERITKTWSVGWRTWGEVVGSEIEMLLKAGKDVNEAINSVFANRSIPDQISQATEGAVVNAAAAGFGIKPAEIAAPQIAEVAKKLNTTPWAPDNMPLSDRLHNLTPTMRAVINKTISGQLAAGTNWTDLSRKIYDGYGYGGQIRVADMPQYLNKLLQLGRKNLTDPADFAEYRKAIAAARRNVAGLGANDAPNRALQSAYSKLLAAAETGSDKALTKAIDLAVNEKARYHAERIARTEIARAWTDGFFAANQEDPDVIGYRWRLSSRHLTPDICDVHAKADIFGLGPGVFPKDKVAPQPAHPHCTCHMEAVFKGELDGLAASYQDMGHLLRTRNFFKSLPAGEAGAILGPQGMTALRIGDDVRPYIPGWRKYEDPATRLKSTDFIKPTAPVLPVVNVTPPIIHAATAPKTAAFEQVPDHRRAGIVDELAKAPIAYQEIAAKLYQQMKYKIHGSSECYGSEVRMFEYKDPAQYIRTFFHEFGHFIDQAAYSIINKRPYIAHTGLSETARFLDANKADYATFQRRGAAGKALHDEIYSYLKSTGKYYDHPAISDIFCSITGGSMRGRWGHSDEYYKKNPTYRGAETFAELFQMFVQNDLEGIAFVRKYLPNTVAEFEKIISEIGGF